MFSFFSRESFFFSERLLCYDSDVKANVEKVDTRSRATSRQEKIGRCSGSAINRLRAHPG